MVIKAFLNLFVGAFKLAVSGFKTFNIPVSLVGNLAAFAKYGSYVVGSDLLLTFAACVFFWMSFKLTLGILIFFWKMMPFT